MDDDNNVMMFITFTIYVFIILVVPNLTLAIGASNACVVLKHRLLDERYPWSQRLEILEQFSKDNDVNRFVNSLSSLQSFLSIYLHIIIWIPLIFFIILLSAHIFLALFVACILIFFINCIFGMISYAYSFKLKHIQKVMRNILDQIKSSSTSSSQIDPDMSDDTSFFISSIPPNSQTQIIHIEDSITGLNFLYGFIIWLHMNEAVLYLFLILGFLFIVKPVFIQHDQSEQSNPIVST